MSALISTIRESRQRVWEQAKALADRAAAENRAFDGEEQSQWDRLNADLDAYDERLRQLAGEEQRANSAAGAMDRYSGGTGRRSVTDAELVGQFRSAILERNPAPIHIRWDNARSYYQPGVERRDLVTTAPSAMSPVSFYSRLVEHMVENSAVMAAGATVLNTSSGESLRIPRSSALSTAGIVSEAGLIPESDPTLSSLTLGAYKYGFMVQVSTELVQDAGFDLEGYLAREAGQAIGLGLGAHLVTGTGTGQPRGVVTDATAGVTGPTGTATSFGSQGTVGQGGDLLIQLFGSLAAPYARSRSAAWLMNSTTLAAVRKIKSTTDGKYAFDINVPEGSGASGMLLGRPIYVDPFVASPAANAKSVLFGDFSRYFVRMVNGIRFERSDDFDFDNDMVTFRALLRVDAALVDTTGAIKYFAHSAT